MYNAVGLEPWEVVVASGIFAVCMVALATTIGFTLAWLLLRERSDVRHPVVAPSETRQPEFAVAAPSHA